MPALGSDMDEGTLDEWLVKPGDRVTRGQIVAVVETTKAAVEIECWQEGTVSELVVPVGETVQVGTVLATLLAPGERAEKHLATASAVDESRHKAGGGTVKAAGRRRHFPDGPATTSLGITGRAPPGPISACRYRRGERHRSAGGSHHKRHRTRRRHVEHAAASKEPATKPKTKPTSADRAAQIRKSIAAAMSRSKREIPHYYLADEIILENSLTWLTTRNAQRSIDERVLPAVLLLKAVGIAAQRFGEFNGFWRDDGFQPATGVHVGVGISLRGGGLVAPAIHDVPDKKLDELMDDLTDLVARARSFSLRSSEMSDPTITVTNLGDKGVDAVFGVIYPPQVALVGFGQPAQRVCVIDGGIRVVTAVQATLAADHRASDGHRGALFLTAINELLQQPDLLEK